MGRAGHSLREEIDTCERELLSVVMAGAGWPSRGRSAPWIVGRREGSEMTDEQCGETMVVDLLALARVDDAQGPIWAHAGEDLNANLIRLAAGAGVAAHVNGEVEVLLVGIAGGGIVEIDGRWHELGAGQALVIPKGTLRAIEAGDNGFSYLTCHRRRAALWPENVARHPPGQR